MAESKLQREIKKKGTFDCLEQEAFLSICRTYRLLAMQFDRLVREQGLSAPQYNILRILRGQKGKGLPSSQIAPRMISCVPDISRLVDRLVKSGLVKRKRSKADRRVVEIAIAKDGMDLLEKLDKPVRILDKGLLGHMTKEELIDVIRLMDKARQNIANDKQPTKGAK